MDGRRRKTVHAARRPEERPKDASHSSTFTECTAAMLTLPSFAGPTSARSVTRTVRMRFSVGTPGGDRPQTAPQMLTAPGERRIVGGGEIEAHHPEQGVQEPFGLAQREMGEESQGQGGLDGEIRVAPLPTPPAAPAGRPGSDRLRG